MEAKQEPQPLKEAGDVARECGVTPAAIRASMRALGVQPDYSTSRGGLYRPETVARFRELRRARGLSA